jgi:hypothetical protein
MTEKLLGWEIQLERRTKKRELRRVELRGSYMGLKMDCPLAKVVCQMNTGQEISLVMKKELRTECMRKEWRAVKTLPGGYHCSLQKVFLWLDIPGQRHHKAL